MAVLALGMGAAATSSASAAIVSFQTPSKRIACIVVDGRSIRCDGPDRRPGPTPRSCDLDYGGAFAMRQTGRSARICRGDTALNPRAPVLRYGRTFGRFGFTCTSRTSGLTCRNRSGRGWFISLQRSYLI